MKYSVVATLLISAASQVAAQASCLSVALTAVPQCAQGCLESAGGVAGCAITDFSCQCASSNSVKISTLAESCVVKSCGITGAPAVIAGASSVCACAAGAASTPASSAATATSAAASMASSMASAASMSGSMMASSMMASSAMASSMASSMASAASAATTPIQTGAAATMGLGAFGGLAAGILGLAAAL